MLKHESSHLLESQRLGLVQNTSLGASAPIVEVRTEQPLSGEGCKAKSEHRLNGIPNSPSGPLELQSSFRQIEQSQEPKSTWKFGFTCITGTLQLELYQSPSAETSGASAASEDEKIYDSKTERSLLGVPKARIKISLPIWWSGKVIETLVYRSQVGWSQLLRTRSITNTSDGCYSRALRNIKTGDLGALVKQFDQRQTTPWDELTCGWNLFSVSDHLALVYDDH